MGPTKLRILICVIALVIVALVRLAITDLGRKGTEAPIAPIPIASPTDLGTTAPAESPVQSPAELPEPTVSPSDLPEESPAVSPAESPSTTTALPPSFVGKIKLLIPVAGVRPEQLIDTFDDARSEGRVHDAIDIPAPAGTSVLAAADGRIVKLFQSERGGTTIYQLSGDQKLIFYYAHLSGYANGLAEGNQVRQGDVIAYVGDTGNAGPGNFHLHFSIAIVSDPKRYWDGTNINPYPLLRPQP